MTIRLRVVWKNAGHPLLPEAGAAIRAEADGAPLTPVAVKAGLREFDVPSGTAKVSLKAEFTASFGPVGSGQHRVEPRSEVVLSAAQTYTVVNNGTELDPDFDPAFLQQHPLIDTKTLATGNGAVLAQIHTEFVDIREFWRRYSAADIASKADADLYKRDHDAAATDLVPLGFTSGDPKIWLITAPISLAFPDRSDISALVFYRPANDAYSRIDQVQSMFRANRYLLPQIPGSTVVEESDQFRDGYVWLRAEFEKAVSAAKRPVVLLQPWPSNTNFGLATSRQLPELVNAAIRLLWTLKIIAVDRAGVRLGRLGISGYSAGGVAMWQSLANNGKAVRELFSFDANDTAANAERAIRWFRSNPDNRLRMSGGLHIAANRAIEQAILKLDPGAATRVSAAPRSRADFAAGVNPYWDHVVALEPQLRFDLNALHQFAIFGSFPGTSTPRVSFLEQFLNDSGF